MCNIAAIQVYLLLIAKLVSIYSNFTELIVDLLNCTCIRYLEYNKQFKILYIYT